MFRFSIRDVLWLTVVVGLAIAWWQADHRRADQAIRLIHLRGNFEDVRAAGKDYVGMHIKGDAEQTKVSIEIEVHPTKTERPNSN